MKCYTIGVLDFEFKASSCTSNYQSLLFVCRTPVSSTYGLDKVEGFRGVGVGWFIRFRVEGTWTPKSR